MPEYLVWFFNDYCDFRIPDLESCAACYSVPIKHENNLKEDDVFYIVDFPSEELAKKTIKRSVLIHGVFELWGQGNTFEECIESCGNFYKENQQHADNFIKEDLSYAINVENYGYKWQRKEKVELLQRFTTIPWKGKVNLKNPDVEFYIFLDFELHSNKLKKCYFARKLGEGSRHLITDFDLKKRKYIGTTSMNATLSFLSANLVLSSPKTLIYDPFVGTGSLIVSAAYYGANVIGSDLDIRVVRGKNFYVKGEVKSDSNIRTNFNDYNLTKRSGLDLLRVDLAQTEVWKCCSKKSNIAKPIFDGIVCDPPYGNREGPRKIGRNKPLDENTTAYTFKDYIPGTVSYDVEDMYYDLLEFAAKAIITKGRIVFWYFSRNDEYSDEKLPKHRCFKLIYNSVDQLTKSYHRRLVTMEKICDYFYADERPSSKVTTTSNSEDESQLLGKHSLPTEQESIQKKNKN
ncbi:hypothetical protein ABK040_007474 [Willaertia magna]